MSSWFPTAEKPFLGNFVEFQATLLSQKYKVSFLRLLSQYQQPHPETNNQSFEYIDVFYKKSKNPILTYLSKKRALEKAIKNCDATLIHGHISFPDGWLFRLAKKQLKIPLVLTEHGSYYSPSTKWNKRMYFSIPKTLKAADKVIAVSSFLAKDINLRFPKLKIEVVGNHLKQLSFHKEQAPAELTFLHISTLSRVKNVAPIFYAFSEFVKTHPTAQLIIVSDENTSEFEQLSAKLKLTQNCSFHGPVAHDAITEYYKKASCFIMNSNYESFSIVMAEAWQHGIPIISTPVGIASGMSPKYGFLSDGSKESILNAMNLFAERKSEFNSENIRQSVEKYGEKEILRQLEIVYGD